MRNTAQIKKDNKRRIWEIFRDGRPYTKQEVAALSQLSIATCSTILNEMEQAGEVVGKKVQENEVGRCSVKYVLNEEYESFLCIGFELIRGERNLFWHVMSTVGRILEKGSEHPEQIDFEVLKEKISCIIGFYPNIRAIAVGTPSVAEHGWIRHCDLPEFEDVPVVEMLEECFRIPVHLENDMHYKVYGYYLKECEPSDIVSLINYPERVLPGMGTVVGGKVVKGRNQFAGMVGFLPNGVSREEQIQNLVPGKYLPYLVFSAESVIPVLNPGRIVFTGDLIKENHIAVVREECMNVIPKEYIPELVWEPDVSNYYLEGMFQRALEEKIKITFE